MIQTVVFLFTVIIIIASIWLIPNLIKFRRRRIQNRPFPLHWASVIEQNLPIYSRLNPSLRRKLHGHIQIFIREKQFIGCGGLQITDEIKLTIATQASLLLLNERGEYYPKLCSILVYPGAFVVNQSESVDYYFVEQRKVPKIGESWARGEVILSWENIKRDTNNWGDGHNVILHEFAHQLDQEDGKADGVPILESKSAYVSWAQVFTKEYKQLLFAVEQNYRTVIDKYGATNPAEFFAVATETFFEKPLQMKKNHPDLYDELKHYYKLDPIEWI